MRLPPVYGARFAPAPLRGETILGDSDSVDLIRSSLFKAGGVGRPSRSNADGLRAAMAQRSCSVIPLSPSPFLSKDEYVFQQICREVFSHEPEISGCEIYGTRGQSQRGVDLWAARRTDQKIEVGQCKRCGVLTVRHIEAATKEFFAHWDFWKSQGVRRFVLFAACDISTRKVQDAIFRQRALFAKKRVKYEAWGLDDLKGKLIPFRQVVHSLYGPDVTDTICGPMAETPALRATHQWMNHHLGVVLTELETGRTAQLDGLRTKSREGRHAEALAEVEAIKAAPSWVAFTPILQARYLRFEAALRLNLKQSASIASGIVSQARMLDPQGDFQVIDAYLEYAAGKSSEALNLLAAPRSLDGWNFRWGLLIEGGRSAEVAAEVAQVQGGIVPNGETHRLLAIAALLAGDLSSAEAESARAKSISPMHHGVRMVAAATDYFSCIVLEPGTPVPLNWPPPVSWAYVKRDLESIARLRRAADEFGRLAAEATDQSDEREQMEAYQLAALACDSSRRNEASAFGGQLLAANPAHYRAAAWAVERDFPFDCDAVAKALASLLDAAIPPNTDIVLACCAVLLAGNKIAEAEAVLDRAQSTFAARGGIDIWRAQKAHFLAGRGKTREAAAIADKIGDSGVRGEARFNASRVAARKDNEFKLLAEELEREYRANGSLHALFNCCDLRVRTKEWKFISDHAIELVAKVGTDAALRLALHGAFLHGEYELCLQLIRDHAGLFQGGQLSPETRALRAECQQKLGHWQDAIAEAETLYRERQTVQRFSDYFRLLIETADVQRCTLAARELLQLPDVGPDLLLQAAKVTRLQDQQLARELWRRAVKPPLRDTNTMTAALGLAYELGIEREAGAIQQRLFAQAREGRGPVQAKTFDELVAFLQEQRQEQERLNRIYNESGAPIHFIARQLGAPLVEPYHAGLVRNRASSNLMAAPALLARYGGRKMPERYGPDTIFADVTGLILAADLEILDQIESSFSPINISAEATGSLMEQLGRLTPHQPSQHVRRAELLRLVRNGQIGVAARPTSAPVVDPAVAELGDEWVTQWQFAASEDGAVLAEYPLVGHESDSRPVALPPAMTERVFNLREFLCALHFAGGLTKREWEAAVTAGTPLAQQPQRLDSELRWPAKRVVALTGALFGILMDGAWLASAAAHFRLIISSEALKVAEHEETAYACRTDLANWTRALLDRVQRGIAQKRYRVLPQTATPQKEKERLGPDGLGIGALLRAVGGSKSGVLWCDDRMVNRHLLVGSRPIVGIVEVLLMLRGKGVLSDADYFEKLIHLRRSNVRYLPATTEEIIHHLRQAVVTEGRLVETPALACLRRYINACLLDRERLLPPQKSAGEGRQDIREWDFAIQTRRAADEALRKIWNQESDSLEIRTAQADWLWRCLYIEVLGMRQALIVERQSGEERELTAFSIGSMFTLGILLPLTVPGASAATVPPRKAYYNWLTEQVLLPLDQSNPGFIDLVAKIVAGDVTATTKAAQREKRPKFRKGKCALMGQLVWNLPNELLQKLDLAPEVLKAIGLAAQGPAISIEGSDFDFAAFWAAQTEAINHRQGFVVDRTGTRELAFVRQDVAEGVALRVKDSAAAEPKVWREPAYPLMLDDTAERIAFLEKHPDWFDCPEADRRDAIHRIVSSERPADRANRIHEWINQSPTIKYRQLTAAFRGQEGIAADDLRLPSWARLRAHLRLADATDGNPIEQLATAADSIVREVGLVAALRRFICLPVRLPERLVQAWQSLPTSDASQEWAKLRRGGPSPVASLHLLRLGLARTDIELKQIISLLEELFEPTKSEDLYDSFTAILVWVATDFARWMDGRSLPASQRLLMIWYHASRLHTLFRIGNADLGKLPAWLGEQTGSWNESILAYEPEFVGDIAHPIDATSGCLRICGVINTLAGFPEDRVRGLETPALWKTLAAENPRLAITLQIDLVRRVDLARDVLGAIFRPPPQSDSNRIFGSEIAQEMFPANSDKNIVEWIAGVAREPFVQLSWMMLQASIRDLPPPPACCESLMEALLHVDFVELLRREPEWGGVALVFAAGQAHHLNNSAVSARIEDQVIAAARVVDVADAPAESHRPLWFFQALLPLSLVRGDETTTAGNYFSRVEKLVQAQPAFTKILWRAVKHWAVSLPFSQQRAFWRLLLTVRALH